jgi:hypothetical protein
MSERLIIRVGLFAVVTVTAAMLVGMYSPTWMQLLLLY